MLTERAKRIEYLLWVTGVVVLAFTIGTGVAIEHSAKAADPPESAHTRICQFVRMYVKYVGHAQAKVDAEANGVTAAQITLAKQCMLGQ